MKKLIIIGIVLLCGCCAASAQSSLPGSRLEIPLHGEYPWKSIVREDFEGFERPDYDDSDWQTVYIPHNWDRYEGYRNAPDGNRRGTAGYRTTFRLPEFGSDKRVFLYFEGVGSYSAVYVNGQEAGTHAGGQTGFSLDITDMARSGETNTLAVWADHPYRIVDLPWGASGSQPFGIFRPVTVVITGDVRIEPFGHHIWSELKNQAKEADLFVRSEIRNYGPQPRKLIIVTSVFNGSRSIGRLVLEEVTLEVGASRIVTQELTGLQNPALWSPERPFQHVILTEIRENGRTIDWIRTPFGIRESRWNLNGNGSEKPFSINGMAVFLNGVNENEHRFGLNYALGEEQVRARVAQVLSAGFNAVREDQPHNLRASSFYDGNGLLWWARLTSQPLSDTPIAREATKQLLRDFVKERRNHPSLVVWELFPPGTVSPEFAAECEAIVKELDPTAGSQRLIFTGSSQESTSYHRWQNGDPEQYADELIRHKLIGEYGIPRVFEQHVSTPTDAQFAVSEEHMTRVLQRILEQADSVSEQAAGHFYASFRSPQAGGPETGAEAFRTIDRIGPTTNNGLFTPWGEPTDAWYLFRSRYTPKEAAPIVHIASHTQPDRWITEGYKSGITVWSNCDSVELFNNLGGGSLGKISRDSMNGRFVWNLAPIVTNVLYAEGSVGGQVVATDWVFLNHLSEPLAINYLFDLSENVTQPDPYLTYLYRVNCGGSGAVDQNGAFWMADRQQRSDSTWGSHSWAEAFEGTNPVLGSQRKTFDPVWNAEWPLFQTFRYGMDELKYEFPVPDGEYVIELYFMEPWYGREQNTYAKGWRLFDVAVNGETMIRDLDLWDMRGANMAQKRVIRKEITGGLLTVSFPRVAAGQAVISAIAIATEKRNLKPAEPSPPLLEVSGGRWEWQNWLSTGDSQYVNTYIGFASLPPELPGTEWARAPFGESPRFTAKVTDDARVYLLFEAGQRVPAWLGSEWQKTDKQTVNGLNGQHDVYTRVYRKGEEIRLQSNSSLANVIAIPLTEE